MTASVRAPADAVVRPEQLLIGEHPSVVEVRQQLRDVAASRLPVVLVGETGSGKEVAAELLHRLAGRRGPHVPVNVATIPEQLAEAMMFGVVKGAYTGADTTRPGLFQEAHGGTLYLDESEDLSPGSQARLLRALESDLVRPVGSMRAEPVDVRVVVSVQRSPVELVRDRRWREDFMHRVAGAVVLLPPLRERIDDLPLLVNHFLARLGRPALDSASLHELRLHAWPGNVRELRLLVERASVMAGRDAITAPGLVAMLQRAGPRDRVGCEQGRSDQPAGTLREAMRRHIEQVLCACDGDVSRAAQWLGLSRSQLYRRIDTMAITRPSCLARAPRRGGGAGRAGRERHQ